MYLTILLFASIFTICSIFLLNIKEQKQQIIIFMMSLVFLSLFCYLCKLMTNESPSKELKKELEKENQNIKTIPQPKENIQMKIEDKKCEIPKKEIYTEDKIIPLESYNQRDCTNDNTCIIQPDTKNMFPGFVKINKKREECGDKLININNNSNDDTENNKGYMVAQPKCKDCGRILSLINNPTSEKFKFKNPYDLTHDCDNFNINNLTKEQNVCIHCSQFSDFKF